MNDIADQQQRHKALDPHHSFIVQAPAGSGKTELLTQRILTLLAESVTNPEEIIAITFTRKAASEMRERIISSIQMAQHEKPIEPHKQLTWQIARKVLAKDQQLQWNLLQNSNRLRILTIDALSSMLNSFTPILSSLGANVRIADDATILYQKTSERLLLTLLNDPKKNAAISRVLLHLDNRIPLFINLCNRLLAKREQWLPYIIIEKTNHPLLKQLLENSLQQIVMDNLATTTKLFNQQLWDYLIQNVNKAAESLRQSNPQHQACILATLNKPLQNHIDDFKSWHALANILLTQKFEWRKTIDKRLGFEANSEHKKAMCELLASLSDHNELENALATLLRSPPTHYSTSQWEVLASLLEVLPLLVANLHLTMQEQSMIDFTELSLAALRSLGDEQKPTDLALYLDYQIKHLLIDEYQDTSMTQFKLIQMLTAGWEADDGRTAFFVGDPMQSIYRFRNAEVSLFLTTKQYGINQIHCNNLTLQVNFRSTTSLVNWTNQTYQQVFPDQANSITGAISYSASTAHNSNTDHAVNYYATIRNQAQQGIIISNIILELQAKYPDESIALLVRSRNQLREVIPALQQHNIAYQAIDIDPLINQPEIQDLLTISRSLLHHADSCAWLALLRAPWCGLTLTDLQIISCNKNQTIWSNLQNPETLKQLSTDGHSRIIQLIAIIKTAISQKGRISLTENIKTIWYKLAGPTCVTGRQALANCFDYFKFLEQLEAEQATLSTHQLLDAITRLYAKPNNQAGNCIQIMTIHKSKGLEFDHVILPNIAYSPKANSSELLLWQEQPRPDGNNQLLLAPIKAQTELTDPIYDFVEFHEKQKRDLETARLLYVATTRAKKTLHLTTELSPIEKEEGAFKAPTKGSFLHLLWPLYQQKFTANIIEASNQSTDAATEKPYLLYRLPQNIISPINITQQQPEQLQHHNAFDINQINNIEPERICGTIIHAMFEKIANQSLPEWDEDHINQQSNIWQRQLRTQLIPENETMNCMQKVKLAITNILSDPKGQWILSNQHKLCKSEYAISFSDNDTCKQLIIDRFIIDNNNTAWIIDYKTSSPSNQQSLSGFLQQEASHYKQQLQQYASVIKSIYNIEIRCALYFPMIKTWHELDELTLNKSGHMEYI